MNLLRVLAVTKKEFIHIGRDPRSLGMGIAIPLLLLFLFGYALTLDVDRVPLMVWDQDQTPASRELVSRFSGSRYFALVLQTDNYRDVVRAVDRREAVIALIIPAGFAGRLASGRTVAIQTILDGSDPNTATFALGYAEAVCLGYSREMVLTQLRRHGFHPPRPPLEIRSRVWFNEDLVSRNYIFPGLIAVIMMIIAALLTSLTVAREWETGSMEQLISTPLTGPELVVGKMIPYMAIGLLDLILSILVGVIVFQVPFRGSLPLLFGTSFLFLIGALSLGMLISIIARNQLLASQIALVGTMLPAFLLSGFIFPIENMPALIRGITHLISARYFVTILRGIFLKDVGLTILAGEALFLIIFGMLVFTASIRRFKKQIQ